MHPGHSVLNLQEFILRHPVGMDDEKAPQFYDAIARYFNFSNQKIAFIAVVHMDNKLPYFLQGLDRIGEVAVIIPKSSIYVPRVEASLNATYRTLIRRDIKKELLTEKEDARKFLNGIISQYSGYRLIIVDHGGYFAPCLHILKEEFANHIAGIVEHTLNGEIRYKKIMTDKDGQPKLQVPFPVFSIASSSFKAYEDDHVAASIVNSMNANIFSGAGIHQDLSRLQIGIIGYGHIGEAVAKRLLKIVAVDQIMICDTNSDRVKVAKRLFSRVNTDKTSLLECCDVIITAASAQVLGKKAFRDMKRNACVICVTSSDDQFEPDALEELTKIALSPERSIEVDSSPEGSAHIASSSKRSTKVKPIAPVSVYKRPAGDHIYLAYNGKAVNFPIGSTPHPILHGVLACVCVSVFKCARAKPSVSIQTLNQSEFCDIEKIYEATFGRIEHAIDTFGLQSSSCYFVGRREEIAQLKEVLDENRVGVVSQAIAGLGGMGKSTLASKYAKNCLRSGEYHLVARFDATTAKTLYEDFILFALHLGIRKPHQRGSKELIQAVYQRLSTTPRLLIIFDNADKYSSLQHAWIKNEEVDFLPPVQANQLVHCIVTTRNQNFQSFGVIALGELQLEDACEYIQHHLPTVTNEEATELANTLSCFPLALCQMVAYLQQNSASVSAQAYLAAYKKEQLSQADLLQANVLPEDRYRATVYTTWNISVQALGEKNYLSVYLLKIFAYFDAMPIPKVLLQKLDSFSEEELMTAIRDLQAYSLVEVDEKNQTFRFHDLVQTVSRLQQDKDKDNEFGVFYESFTLAYDYGMSLGEPSSFVRHGLKVTQYYDRQFPQESIPRKILLLRHLGTAQHYALLFTQEAAATYQFAQRICDRSSEGNPFRLGIRLGSANAESAQDPSQFIVIIDQMLRDDTLTFEQVMTELRQRNIHVDLASAKQKILTSLNANPGALLIARHLVPNFDNLTPHQFFETLLSSNIKSLWLPFTPMILASVGARDIAIAYLIFKNDLLQAEDMARQYLRDTVDQYSNDRMQALCLSVETLAFQGKLPRDKHIPSLLEASQILQRADANHFYYDQVHFLLSILYAVNNEFEESHRVVFRLLDKLVQKHGAEGVRQRIATLVKMLAPLEKNLNDSSANMLEMHQEQLKLLLAQSFRMAGRLLLVFKESERAKEYFQKSMYYDPNCPLTRYEYGRLLARDGETRANSLRFFQDIDKSQIEQPYSHFSSEIECALPKFLRPLVGEAHGYSLYFLAFCWLAWVACREQRFEDCRMGLKNLQTYGNHPLFPVASVQLLEEKLARKDITTGKDKDKGKVMSL